ncbi:hypothetical protein [Sorangium sp. So ce1151]|uniref:hypothetical protein n=1 Tax=Sorangium sp. So ce1151 TaxID=3133332 RepID=UPI003F638833
MDHSFRIARHLASRTHTGRHAKRIGVATVSLLALLFAWTYRGFSFDDAFITFRYAKNLAEGAGPVFNPGERVEGFSSSVWMLVSALLMTVVGKDALSLIAAIKVVGLLFGLLAVLGCWRLAEDLVPERPSLAGFLGALVLVTTGYFPIWAVGGLETPLFCAEIAWFAVFLVEERATGRAKPSFRPALLAIALAWTRPEGALLAALFCCHLLLDVARRRASWRTLGPALACACGVALLFGLRWAYYGELLPNTYYAKSSQARLSSAMSGFFYVFKWLTGLDAAVHRWSIPVSSAMGDIPYPPGAALFGAALLGAVRPGGRRSARLLTGGLALALICATVVEGGDWMPGFRFLVPAFPLLAALSAAALCGPLERLRPGVRLLVGISAALVIGAPWAALLQFRIDRAGTARGAELISSQYVRAGSWLKTHVPADSVLAIGEAGIVPYISEHRYIDLFGLNDKVVARMPGYWFYKKPTDYVLSRDPDYIVLAGDMAPDPGWAARFPPHLREQFMSHRRFLYPHGDALARSAAFRERYREIAAVGRPSSADNFVIFCRINEGPTTRTCRRPLL